jgi:hypothetical protein
VAVEKSKARIVDVDEGTVGGDTYIIKIPGQHEQALCFRRIHKKKGMRCTNVAGYKTNHVGTGACSFHGGRTTENPNIVTGRYAKSTKARLDGQIQEYLERDRDDLLDLTYHLAATRVIFDEFLEEFPKADADDYGLWLGRFQGVVGTLGTLVEKITKVDARNSLTAAQVLYIRACIVDILLKYIPEADMRERAIRELANRMGGDVEVTMKPSEIPGVKMLND